jgi:hypothetical protein
MRLSSKALDHDEPVERLGSPARSLRQRAPRRSTQASIPSSRSTPSGYPSGHAFGRPSAASSNSAVPRSYGQSTFLKTAGRRQSSPSSRRRSRSRRRPGPGAAARPGRRRARVSWRAAMRPPAQGAPAREPRRAAGPTGVVRHPAFRRNLPRRRTATVTTKSRTSRFSSTDQPSCRRVVRAVPRPLVHTDC